MKENNLNHTRIDKDHGHHMTPRVRRVLEKANKISLTHEEKHQGAKDLHAFMAENPAVVTAVTPAATADVVPASGTPNVRSPYFSQITALFASTSLSIRKKVLVPIAAVLVFVIATGTTYAAGEALPGDVLYPVKINVKEKVESFLAVKSETKARVAASHAAARLDEAERLAEQGRLDADTQAKLEDDFSKHTAEFNQNAEMMRAEGKGEAVIAVNSEFEASLRGHQKTLAALAERSENSDKISSMAATSTVKVRKGSVLNLKAAVKSRLDGIRNAAIEDRDDIGQDDTRKTIKKSRAKEYRPVEVTSTAATAVASSSSAKEGVESSAELSAPTSVQVTSSSATISGGTAAPSAPAVTVPATPSVPVTIPAILTP